MDVRLQDGTVVQNVPDGITQSQLMARLAKGGHNVGAPQESDTLGLYQGAAHVLGNLASGAKYLANQAGRPFGVPLGDKIDQFGQAVGLPSTEQANQSYSDYIAQQATQGRVPSARGRIVGEIGASIPLALAAPEALTGGALAGAASTNANDVSGVLRDAAMGAVAGKVGEAAVGAAARAIPRSFVQPASSAAIKQAGRQAYQTADSSGMVISGKAMQGMAQNMESDLASKGIDSTLHPKAMAAVNRIQDAATSPQTGGNVTLQGLDVLRKVAGQAAKSIEPADKFMGRAIQDHIDDFVANLKPTDVLGGAKDQGAINALGQARQLWNTASKGEIIDSAVQKAQNMSQYTQSGYENALRTRFRQIANNDRAMSRFSSDEQDAIRQVAQGTNIANAMRFIGKFAPRGVVSAAGSMMAGNAIGVGGIPLMMAGEAGRAGAKMATQRSADYASALIRNAGVAPQKVAGPTAKLLTNLRSPIRAALPGLAVQATEPTTQ